MEFIDLKSQYKVLKGEIDREIQDVLSDAHFILGDRVKRFENKLAEYIGVKYVVACSDGTAALQLIFMSYGIGKGDVVFCPDMTFIASIEPACLLGATPVFCDIDMKSYNISSESLERQIQAVIKEGRYTPKAIVAVDFVGNPVDFEAIRLVARKYDLLLIEDAAQGIGATYHGIKCGSLGDVGATSFFPSKPLGGYGDGGAVFTNDAAIADKLRSLRVHGKGIDKYHNIYIGINSRLDELQAAVLLVKLNALENEMVRRQKIAEYYADAIKEKYIVPEIAEGCMSSYAQFVIMNRKPGMRETIINGLKQYHIPTILYYPVPMHRLPVFEGVNCYGEKYKNTEFYSREHFGIPFSPYITKEDIDKVVSVLMKY